MSDQVYRWNREQVKIHNIGTRPILIRDLKLPNTEDEHIIRNSCFKQYMCNRNTCVNDSAMCQVNKCSDNREFDQKALCYYSNNPSDDIYTLNIFSKNK